MKRTHTCGELTLKNTNKKVILQGWVSKVRKMGAMTFIDLRDRYGITQLIIDEKLINESNLIKPEFVIEVSGVVIERKSKNKNLITGEIEINVDKIEIINKSELTPFEIKDNIESQEDTRLTHRYLDLRRPEMQNNLLLRSKTNHIVRNFFVNNNFVEIETPIFGRSTPEGARDFLVPSRLNKNKFYALPQSPQLYKQLLMISGFDKYYQIARCFRDEDLRIDRQPEFTQLDMEMSFANHEDVIGMIENLMVNILKEIKNINLKLPLKRITWKESMDKYGNDKPDLRFGLEIETLNDIFKNTEIPLFLNFEKDKKFIRAICIDKIITNKNLETLTEVAKQNSAKILSFAKFEKNVWSGSVGSKLSESEKKELIKRFKLKNEGTILFISDSYEIATQAMGAIRNQLAKLFELINDNEYNLLWVVNFPLFEYSEEEKRYVAAHHPFTMPTEKSIKDFDVNKATAEANAYDIVMNGFEIGGGSQRITDSVIQNRMFEALGMTKAEIEDNFGWFINGYKYGAPYHSGCALGLDRICMLLANAKNIREVIAFPKNSSGIDPMSNAPNEVSINQLNELELKLKN